ncbi:MAG: MBL fold metallo-hydrolase [Caldimonas sp.]
MTASRPEGAPLLVSTPADDPPHHDGDRFRNHYVGFEPKSLAEVLRWRIDAARHGLPPPPRAPTPRVAPDLAFLRANATAGKAMTPALTWIGHASVLAQIGGLNLLIDPVFSERASPLTFAGPRRQAAPGLALADLPPIDAVLISHNHYDHLDLETVRSLAEGAGTRPPFVVPLGLAAWFASNGVAGAVELDWWQSSRVGDTEIVLAPAQHWSGRGLADRMKTLWGGFAVFAPGFQLFHCGDTAYSRDFADIHTRFAARHGGDERGFDLALIPIGAYEPRWFMRGQHVNPAEAVRIHLDLVAERSIGIHWGTFQLSDEALDEPPRALSEARRDQCVADEAFDVMAIGETRHYPTRTT